MGNFEPAFSDEMMDQLVVEVYEYVKEGTLSELKVRGVANELIKKLDADGELMFYDIRTKSEKKPIHADTMTGRVRIIVKDWKIYLGPLMLPHIIEATYEHATKAKDSTQSFKIVADAITPPEKNDDSSKFALSPGAEDLLHRKRVAAVVVVGQDGTVTAMGNRGYECADSVHPVADRQQEDTPTEAVPPGNDKAVHGLLDGEDTTEGSSLPYTTLPPEDAVDNNGGNGVVAAE